MCGKEWLVSDSHGQKSPIYWFNSVGSATKQVMFDVVEHTQEDEFHYLSVGKLADSLKIGTPIYYHAKRGASSKMIGILSRITADSLVVVDVRAALRFLHKYAYGQHAFDYSLIEIEPQQVKIQNVEPAVNTKLPIRIDIDRSMPLSRMLLTLDIGDADFFLKRIVIKVRSRDAKVQITGWHNYRPEHIPLNARLQRVRCKPWSSSSELTTERTGSRGAYEWQLTCDLKIGVVARTLVIESTNADLGEILSIELYE